MMLYAGCSEMSQSILPYMQSYQKYIPSMSTQYHLFNITLMPYLLVLFSLDVLHTI